MTVTIPPRLFAILLSATLLTSTHCGKKPGPKPAASDATTGPKAPGQQKTAGGVSLAGVSPEATKAALRVARQRKAGVYDLIQIGDKATPVAVALLDSVNLEELEGGLAVLRTLRAPAATPKMVALMTHDAAAVRDAARKTLETYPPAALGPALMPVLDHADLAVRANGVRFLGTIGYRPAGDKIRGLLSHGNGDLALEAATALARIGDAQHVAKVLPLIDAEGAAVSQRRAAIIVVRRLGGTVPSTVLAKVLASTDAALVREAARAIAPILDPARTALADTAWRHPAEGVKIALVAGLAAAPVAPASETPPPSPWVEKALASSDPNLRVAGLTAATRHRTGEARRTLLQGALAPENTDLVVRRAAAALAAKHLAAPVAAQTLVAALNREADIDTQRVIVFALAGLNTRAALQALVDKLDHVALDLPSWVALKGISGEQKGREKAVWQDWLDATHPAPKPAPEPTDKPVTAEDKPVPTKLPAKRALPAAAPKTPKVGGPSAPK